MKGVVVNARLVELETVIERGMRSFVEVGTALAEVRDSGLYTQPTFEAYVRERWGFTRQRAYQLIDAADVSTRVDIPLPNEGVARTLVGLPVERQQELAPAIADMTVREARAYVKAAEAPPVEPERSGPLNIIENPSVEADTTGLKALLAALDAVSSMRESIPLILMGLNPAQLKRVRVAGRKAQTAVGYALADILAEGGIQ